MADLALLNQANLAQTVLKIPEMGSIIPDMGISSNSMADALFSKTRQRVLGLLIVNDHRSFYTNEIVRHVESGVGGVQRELESLVDSGLVAVRNIGNQRHFQANRDASIFRELREILVKTCGLADVLRNALAPFAPRIQLALIYGSIAKGNDIAQSDIDLLLVSDDLAYADLIEVLSESEVRLLRKVNPSIFSLEEIRRKLSQGDNFVSRILAQPSIALIGHLDAIARTRESGTDWEPQSRTTKSA